MPEMFIDGRFTAGEVDGLVVLAAAQDANRDECGKRPDEHQDAGPHVQAGGDAQEGDLLGGVDAQHLDPHTARRVNHGVEQEQAPAAQAEPAVHEEQHNNAEEVPDALIQEGRVEESLGAVAGRDKLG